MSLPGFHLHHPHILYIVKNLKSKHPIIEICVTLSLFQVLPASCDLLPSSVLLFRLVTLPNDHSHVSCVVSWGVFPVYDCTLNLLTGKFKTPLLRGGPDPSLNQFRKIEHLLSTDLDNWLCNLYFQVPLQTPLNEVYSCVMCSKFHNI